MKIELANPDRIPMCFIGKYRLTFEQPAEDFDLESLTMQERQQLLFNLQRGVLKTNESNVIERLTHTPQPSQPAVTDKEEEVKQLSSLLNKSVATIKKEASNLSISQLRRILDMETLGKERKSLISFFNKKIKQHHEEVQSRIGNKEIEVQLPPIGVSESQITEVTDSEEEEREVFIPNHS